jgi:transcriptional repressor NrdR
MPSVMSIYWHGLALHYRSAYKEPLRGSLSRRVRNESDTRAIFRRRNTGMNCIYCGGETKVTNSRLQSRNNQVWRRRRCLVCQSVFTTHESVEYESALSVEQDGQISPFLPDLLLNELMMAMQHRKDVYTASREVLSTIVRKLLILPQNPRFSPSDISKVTSEVLKRFDRRAYLRYLADHPSLQ